MEGVTAEDDEAHWQALRAEYELQEAQYLQGLFEYREFHPICAGCDEPILRGQPVVCCGMCGREYCSMMCYAIFDRCEYNEHQAYTKTDLDATSTKVPTHELVDQVLLQVAAPGKQIVFEYLLRNERQRIVDTMTQIRTGQVRSDVVRAAIELMVQIATRRREVIRGNQVVSTEHRELLVQQSQQARLECGTMVQGDGQSQI